jgi:hypothetical protein
MIRDVYGEYAQVMMMKRIVITDKMKDSSEIR